jgi:2-keto-3-deoxy-6-phosphogluconate aldolase
MLKPFLLDFCSSSGLSAFRGLPNGNDFVPIGEASIENVEGYASAAAVAIGLCSEPVTSRGQAENDLIHLPQALLEV